MDTTQAIKVLATVAQEHINGLIKNGQPASAEFTSAGCNQALEVLKQATGFKDAPAVQAVVPSLDQLAKAKKKG
jgi:hypothetical protein